VINWQAGDRVGNVRKGAGNLMIIEADESDRSLLSFHPYYSVITNVSKDHFELTEVINLFNEFRARTESWTLLGPQAAEILDHVPHPELVVQHRSGQTWINWEDTEYPSPMPGRHNAENTLIAVQASRALNVEPAVIYRALSTFRGIHRRLEVVGHAHDVTVLDDYAHNPAKIAASWSAAAENAKRVIGVWRPHGYGPLSLLFNELVDAFANVCRPADHLFILPVYYAGGTAKKTQDDQRLAEVLAARGISAEFVPDYTLLRNNIRSLMKPGDTVIGMGARDPELPEFLRSLLTYDAG